MRPQPLPTGGQLLAVSALDEVGQRPDSTAGWTWSICNNRPSRPATIGLDLLQLSAWIPCKYRPSG